MIKNHLTSQALITVLRDIPRKIGANESLDETLKIINGANNRDSPFLKIPDQNKVNDFLTKIREIEKMLFLVRDGKKVEIDDNAFEKHISSIIDLMNKIQKELDKVTF